MITLIWSLERWILTESTWIGGSDAVIEGQWYWMTSQVTFAFTDWVEGEPNNDRGGEDCVHINPGSGYHWNDASCTIAYKFICEKQVMVLKTHLGNMKFENRSNVSRVVYCLKLCFFLFVEGSLKDNRQLVGGECSYGAAYTVEFCLLCYLLRSSTYFHFWYYNHDGTTKATRCSTSEYFLIRHLKNTCTAFTTSRIRGHKKTGWDGSIRGILDFFFKNIVFWIKPITICDLDQFKDFFQSRTKIWLFGLRLEIISIKSRVIFRNLKESL